MNVLTRANNVLTRHEREPWSSLTAPGESTGCDCRVVGQRQIGNDVVRNVAGHHSAIVQSLVVTLLIDLCPGETRVLTAVDIHGSIQSEQFTVFWNRSDHADDERIQDCGRKNTLRLLTLSLSSSKSYILPTF